MTHWSLIQAIMQTSSVFLSIFLEVISFLLFKFLVEPVFLFFVAVTQPYAILGQIKVSVPYPGMPSTA